jgi:hypothetical protein
MLPRDIEYKYYWTDKKQKSFVGSSDNNMFFDPYVFSYKTFREDKTVVDSVMLESGETVPLDCDWENRPSVAITEYIGKTLSKIRVAVFNGDEMKLNFGTAYVNMKELKDVTKNIPRYTYAQYFQALVDGKVDPHSGLLTKDLR